MSTFAQLVAKPGVGLAYYFDVSTDGFASVLYRYATVSGKFDGTNWYEPRVAKVGAFGRMLDSSAFSSHTIDVEFDNVDGVMDWMVNRTTFASTFFGSLWRFGIYVYDPSNPSDYATKVLGVLEAMEMPRRDSSRVFLTLSDRWQGRSADLAVTPTLRDISSDLTTSDVWGGVFAPDLYDPDKPLPLQFPVTSKAFTQVWRFARGGNYAGMVACCTTHTGAVDAGDLGFGLTFGDGFFDYIPREFGGATLWEPLRSSSVSKDGKTWKVIYLRIDASAVLSSGLYARWQYAFDQNTPAGAVLDNFLDTKSDFRAGVGIGSGAAHPCLSARTAVNASSQNPVDVLYDLVSYYSDFTSSDIDATAYVAARASLPLAEFAGLGGDGIVEVATGGENRKVGGRLSRELAAIAQEAGFDLTASWSGTLLMLPVFDVSKRFTTQAAGDVHELLAKNIVELMPSPGQRWSWDPTYAATSAWGSVWDTWLHGTGATVRPLITLRYTLEALALEIGDFVTFTWSRGGSLGPYTSAFFKVEGITLDCEAGAVELLLVWMDDSNTDAYLLDDEDLLLRVASGGGRTASVTDASSTVTFSSGSLVADGVQAGDLLVLLDATQAATVFTRFRALRITSVTDATHLVVTGDLDFDAGAPTTVSTWKIVMGATDYPTSGSDPTNYPLGGDMYGKTTNTSGVYSDASAGNDLVKG